MAGKKTGKRLLTWVLVLVMALSLLPLNALADELVMAGDPDTSRTQSAEKTVHISSSLPLKMATPIRFSSNRG